MLSHHSSDMNGSFASVVEWDGGDEVMADVCANDVVEEMGVDESEITIDGRSRSTSKGPCLVVVMRHRGIGMLEEGNCNYAVVDPQPRNSPEDNDLPAPENLPSHDETSNHNSDTDVREKNQWQFILLVEDAVLSEIEVGDLHTLRPSILLTGQVEQEISRPAEQLMDHVVP